MTEPIYITAILVSLYLAMEIAVRSSEEVQKTYPWGLILGLGLSLSVAVLLRQLFLLIVPFILLWVWWACRIRGKMKVAPAIGVILAILFLVIAPFTIYNYTRFERFVLLNTNAGFAFYWGNHPIYGTQFVPILTPEMGSYQELVPRDLRALDEAALDQALLKLGIGFVLEDPGRYVLLSLSRIPSYFMFWPSKDSGMISNFSRVASFGLYLPFMIYGLILAIARLPRNLGVLLLGFALLYTMIHLLSWVLIRYRLPVDAVLILFAGLAAYDIAERIGNRRATRHKMEFSRQ
jgi:hypothetical protein